METTLSAWFRNLDNRSNLNGDNRNLNNGNRVRGMALGRGFSFRKNLLKRRMKGREEVFALHLSHENPQ